MFELGVNEIMLLRILLRGLLLKPNHPPFRSHLSTCVPPTIETLPEGSIPPALVLARDVLSLFQPSKMTVLAGDPISLISYLHRQK